MAGGTSASCEMDIVATSLAKQESEADRIALCVDAALKNYERSKRSAIDDMKQVLLDNDWLVQPGFTFDERRGYKNGCFGLAGRTTASVDFVIHDIAHAIVCVEIDETWRLLQDNFDLRIKRQITTDSGTGYDRPNTLQATKMEARAYAIEKHINEALGIELIPNFYDYYARVLIHYSQDAATDVFIPEGYPDPGEYWKTRLPKRIGFIKTWYEKTDIERIKVQWRQVCEIINNQKAAPAVR